ncbi:MAG: hypothetical protein WKG06_11175 [Segetibacter sp.]
MFDTCIILEDKFPEIDRVITKMITNKATYETVANKVNVPWYFISILHCMEGSLSFRTHLHNGDPLTDRTVNVPRGRPLTGNPPFKWEDSAEDALKLDHLVPLTDTNVPGLLFAFESFNGFGSRAHGIHTPYLWSFSNHYIKGKFIRDHVFDPEAVSNQIGAAVLLRRIMERQLTLGESDIITQIRQLGEQVSYDPDHFNAQALQLQKLLNTVGLHLRPDGQAGDRTSEAYEHISGKFLKGDKRTP